MSKLGRFFLSFFIVILSGSLIGVGIWSIKYAKADPDINQEQTNNNQPSDNEDLLADLLAQIAESNALLEAKTTAYNELKATTDAEIATLNEQISAKDAEIATANAELTQTVTDLATAQASVLTLTQQKLDLENQLATETENKAELQAQLDAVNTELETMQNNVTILTAQVETLMAEKTQLETDKQTLTNEKANLQQELEDAESEVVILNARIVELENALNGDGTGREELLELLSCGTICSVTLSNGNLLCSNYNASNLTGIYLIKATDFSVTKVYDSGASWTYFLELSNGNVLLGNMNQGLVFYDAETCSVESIVSNDSAWRYFHELPNGKVLVSRDANYGTYLGLWLFDTDTKSLSQVSSLAGKWSKFLSVNNDYVLISGTVSSMGNLLYNVQSNVVDELTFTNGYYWTSVITQFSDGSSLICGDGSAGKGILYFDSSISEFKEIYSIGYNWNISSTLPNNNVLIVSSSSNGVLLFDFETKSISCLNSSIKARYISSLSNGDALISGYQLGVYYYNSSDNTLSQLYTISSDWSYCYELKNGNALISNQNVSSSPYYIGILLYDSENTTITKIYDSGNSWDTYVEDDNGVTISSSIKPDQGLLYYSYETGEITKL